MNQHSLLRQMVEATGLYTVAFVAGRAASFLLVPIYTRYLTPADYGFMELLDLIGIVAWRNSRSAGPAPAPW